jgi:hypothetical protein
MDIAGSDMNLPAAAIFEAGLPPRDLDDSAWPHWASEAFGFRSITRVGLQTIEPEIIGLIPSDLARELKVVPVTTSSGVNDGVNFGKKGELFLAMTDPLDAETIIEIECQTGVGIIPVIAQGAIIDWALDEHYPLDS